jgi:hypothetical protein
MADWQILLIRLIGGLLVITILAAVLLAVLPT